MERQNLDILPGGVLPVIHCSQGDIGREFQINLFSDNAPYVLDGTEELTIDGHKEDNNIFTYSIPSTTGSTITISTQEQMTACAGNTICEIRIYKDDIRIGTCNFILQVEEGVSNGTPSESTLQALDEIRAEVQQAVEDAQTAQHNAEIAETNAETAETNARNAQSQSESARDLAQTYATNSSNSATDSENSALQSKSWAVGPSGSGSGTDTNNAKYYSQLASQSEQNASASATNASNSASAAYTSETNASNSASAAHTSEVNASNSADDANDSATLAGNKATEAEQSANKVTNMTVSATQLAEGSSPTVTKTVDNVVNLDFGIPKGDTGDTGATPNINITASVDGTTGTPTVTVTKTGTAENPSFDLSFTGLKGAGSVVTFSPTKTSGEEIGQLTINGTTYYLYCSGGSSVTYTDNIGGYYGLASGVLTIDGVDYYIYSPKPKYIPEVSSGTKLGTFQFGAPGTNDIDIYAPKSSASKGVGIGKPVGISTYSKNFFGENMWSDGTDTYYYNMTSPGDNTYIYKAEVDSEGLYFSRFTRATVGAQNCTYGTSIWYNPLDKKTYYNDNYWWYKSSNTWLNVPNRYYNSGTWTNTFDGRHVWTDGIHIYYSYINDQFELLYDASTDTYSSNAVTWSGLTSFHGEHIWTDGIDYYYSDGSNHYKLTPNTNTWVSISWTQAITGENVWTDGVNTYWDDGLNHYRLNKYTNSWESIVRVSSATDGSVSMYGKNVFLAPDGYYYITTTTSYNSGKMFIQLQNKDKSIKAKPM